MKLTLTDFIKGLYSVNRPKSIVVMDTYSSVVTTIHKDQFEEGLITDNDYKDEPVLFFSNRRPTRPVITISYILED